MRIPCFVVFWNLVFLASCGSPTERTNSSITVPSSTSASTLSTESELSTAVVASNLNEMVSIVSAGELAIDTVDLRLASSITYGRTCTADTTAKTATVSISYAGSETKTIGKRTIEQSSKGSETRVWSNTVSNAAIACTLKGKRASIDWGLVDDINGLKLTVNTNRSNTRTTKFTSKTGQSAERTVTDSVTGTRLLAWTATTVTTVSKTSSVNVAHNQTLTRVDGSVSDISAIHATIDGKPLVITRSSDSSGNILTYIIESGTMSISKLGSYYVTNTYENILFDPNSDDPCSPVSGSLTTEIFASDKDTSPLKTLTTTFSSGIGTVSGDTTASDNLASNINRRCDFGSAASS